MIVSRDGQIYQWDTGRVIGATPKDNTRIDEIHAYNQTTTYAVVLETWQEGEWTYAVIPGRLLQTDNRLNIYTVMKTDHGEITIEHEVFYVKRRTKPDDYVLDYQKLGEKITELEKKIANINPKGVVKTINNKEPDENGNIDIETPKIPDGYVKTVNGTAPDENGNVAIDIENTAMDLLIQMQVAPVVLDADGTVLTDSDGAILINS